MKYLGNDSKKKVKYVTLDHVFRFFLNIKHPEFEISSRELEEAFSFSMMTVLNEVDKMAKYGYLVFVEFLEMICRIAIKGIKLQDLIEYRVHLMLVIIWEKMIGLKEFNSTDHPLKEVDESNW